MVNLVVVGGGNMGEALVAGLRRAGARDDIHVVEKLEARRSALVAAHAGLAVVDDLDGVPGPIDEAIVAVKPGDVPAVCQALGGRGVGRVLSIAAGVTLATMEAELEAGGGGQVAVVRAMPNTPALVGQGAAAIAAGRHAGDDDLAWAESVLGAVGRVVRVAEPALDAVTGLSGSGPAYVFMVAEALIDAGVLVGLPRDTAEALALQTLLGAAHMLVESGRTAPELRAMVTSPGGTTAAGLLELERHGLRAAMLAAVQAATDRSRALGA